MGGISKAGIANKKYATETSNCPKCGVPIDTHPQCESCHILCGPGHEMTEVVEFREHNICHACVKKWQLVNRLSGRLTTWEEFMKPSPKILG